MSMLSEYQGYRIEPCRHGGFPAWWEGHSESILLDTSQHHQGVLSECIRKSFQKSARKFWEELCS